MKSQFRPLRPSRITGYSKPGGLWRSAALKFFLTVLFFFVYMAIAGSATAQCMPQPVSPDQRVQQSEVVTEGRILSLRMHCTIAVSQLFKGYTGATLELVVPGWPVGQPDEGIRGEEHCAAWHAVCTVYDLVVVHDNGERKAMKIIK
jgi:hypothetical protein